MAPMRRLDWTRLGDIAWLVALIAVLAAVGLAAVGGQRVRLDVLLPLRGVMFTSYSANTDELRSPPGTGAIPGFRAESEDKAAMLRDRIRASGLAPILDSVRALPGSVERMRALGSAVFAPWGPSLACGAVNDLHDKILELTRRNGCCSDFTEAVLALAPLVAVTAREIGLLDMPHVTTEIFSPELGRWVVYDPNYQVMIADSSGAWLGMADAQRLVLSGSRGALRYVGNPRYAWGGSRASFGAFGVRRSWRTITLTAGTNVAEADAFARRLRGVPKAAAQLISHGAGVRPSYRAYMPGRPWAARALNLRRAALLFALIAGGGAFVAWPFARALQKCMRRNSQSGSMRTPNMTTRHHAGT